jgi:mannose-6-phosphate isomerase-like protein (cupin superfamily)
VPQRQGDGSDPHERDYRYHSLLAYNFLDKASSLSRWTIQTGRPDAEMDLNTHPGQEFDYILSGIMRLIIGTRSFFCTPGIPSTSTRRCPTA